MKDLGSLLILIITVVGGLDILTIVAKKHKNKEK
ncbi:Uncharacterised protein [uncultured Clostridium sp.]|nr:Uncharacterised protein [uncultured Clostridium sp.]